jgi:hypothetical protein
MNLPPFLRRLVTLCTYDAWPLVRWALFEQPVAISRWEDDGGAAGGDEGGWVLSFRRVELGGGR